MSDHPEDFFLRRLVAALRGELFETRQVKFDAWAVGRSLEEQRDFLVRDAMRDWPEEEEKPAVQQELPLHYGKRAAAGDTHD